jgi:hypothetical protein
MVRLIVGRDGSLVATVTVWWKWSHFLVRNVTSTGKVSPGLIVTDLPSLPAPPGVDDLKRSVVVQEQVVLAPRSSRGPAPAFLKVQAWCPVNSWGSLPKS